MSSQGTKDAFWGHYGTAQTPLVLPIWPKVKFLVCAQGLQPSDEGGEGLWGTASQGRWHYHKTARHQGKCLDRAIVGSTQFGASACKCMYVFNHRHVADSLEIAFLQFHPGTGVGIGKDHTIFALDSGIVVFKKTKYIKRVSFCYIL